MKNQETINFKGLVSVGIPTFKRPEMLRRALKIITSQTYNNLEIIISDNNPQQSEVADIVKDFLEIDSRIKYYQQSQNIGVLANAEFVLEKSHGEFFTWFSDDDWRSPEFIEILVEQLNKNPNIEFAFCDYREAYSDGKFPENYPKTHLNFFKPFESKIRFIRTIAYYWQNGRLSGKQNLFYSVFRRSSICNINIKMLTKNYFYLNMDSLIVFKLLQNGPAIISHERMCVLTCGNKKHYEINKIINGGKINIFLNKILNFNIKSFTDLKLFLINTDSFLEKIIFFLFFPFKLASDGIGIIKFNKNKFFEHDYYSMHLNKIDLPTVTLVAMATRDVDATLQALRYSMRGVNFGSVKLISHYTPFGLDADIEFFRINKITSIDEWSYKIVYELNNYVTTDFALLVHADGFVVNPEEWRKEFLEYDYIGAPWPLPRDDFSYRDKFGNLIRVGNSVSLRSKRLLELPTKLPISWEPDNGFFNEDGFICVKNRHLFEAARMKFADLNIAKYFSHESMIPEVRGIRPFAFHKWMGSNSKFPKFR